MCCIVNHGLTRSGKTCTMFGLSGTMGLLGQSGEYILSSTALRVSAFEICAKGCFDLIDTRVAFNGKEKPKEKNVCTFDDFEQLITHINRNRTTTPTNQNAASSRSHLFIILSRDNSHSKMAFVDLAGFENPDGKDDDEETKFINSTLSQLNSLLINVTKKNVVAPSKWNKMTTFLKPFLTSPSQTMIMYHVNNEAPKRGLSYIKDIATSSTVLKRPNSGPLKDITNKSNKMS